MGGPILCGGVEERRARTEPEESEKSRFFFQRDDSCML